MQIQTGAVAADSPRLNSRVEKSILDACVSVCIRQETANIARFTRAVFGPASLTEGDSDQ